MSRTNPKFRARSSETALTTDPATRARNVRALARFLDNSISIPGTDWRFGFDAVVGLVPVVGDLIGGSLSAYILLEAARAEVPILTLARMLANVGIDTIVGSVPALGDVFDAAWKSNMKNVALLERHLAVSAPPTHERRSVIGSAVLAMIALVLIVAAGFAMSIFLARLLWGLKTR
ncbi:MAG TPA: DUF4112 domain-containing protein [Gemmatimonadaceae bacterium]|nr:DUF4112 domain-containing protein [Gemmatimonadaceae bacterium]